MTARTSSGSGLFSAVVGTCVNGDTFTIQEGHEVTVDVNLSTLTAGLGACTINGLLDFKADIDTGLFMNGNLDVNGALYIANRAVMSGFTLTEGKSNVYEIARTLLVTTVEETLGNGYKNAEDELTDLAVSIENYRLHTLYQPEMMADVVKEFRISYRDSLTLADALSYVENNPNTFYHDVVGNKLYIHTSDSTNPSTKTITVIEPINRPGAGTESRCNLKFNSSGVISNTGGGSPIIRMYGWYPQIEWTQLDADAALNATTIVLKEDLGLQQGDKIAIGSGTETGQQVESNAGIYTVSSYNSGTKTVTLTGGLQTARLSGDYVAILSRPIKITRSSGIAGLITTISNGTIIGANSLIRLVYGSYTTILTGWTFKHSSVQVYDTDLAGYCDTPLIEDCTIVNFAYAQKNCLQAIIRRPASINAQINNLGVTKTYDGVMQNVVTDNPTYSTNYFYNCKLKGYKASLGYSRGFVNCEFIGNENTASKITGGQNGECFNCLFSGLTVDAFSAFYGKLYNCLFTGSDGVFEYLSKRRQVHQIVESFDHNQTPGNYKAWMRGGRTITEDNKLKFICESNDYPVFRDYTILAPSNRTIKFLIGLTKDTSGIVTKFQIIDPANDPLIDSTATPLAESIATNTTEAQQIGVAYKSTTSKQLILRILCQNSSGNVLIDTTRIDQSLAKRIS